MATISSASGYNIGVPEESLVKTGTYETAERKVSEIVQKQIFPKFQSSLPGDYCQ